MTTVLIVGLKGQQLFQVERAVRVLRLPIRLKFQNSDWCNRKFGGAHWCVLMTKFISHQHQRIAQRDYHRSRIVLHSGGLSELVKVIGGLPR